MNNAAVRLLTPYSSGRSTIWSLLSAELSSGGGDARAYRTGQAVLAVLNSTTIESGAASRAYTWRGRDSLTIGDPSKWVHYKIVTRSAIHWYSDLGTSGSVQSVPTLTYPDYSALRRCYRFRNVGEIISFLVRTPPIASSLLSAYERLSELFSGATPFDLEFVSDPEGSSSGQLMAYIKTAMPLQDAMSTLDRFDEEWFLDRADELAGLLNFNVVTP